MALKVKFADGTSCEYISCTAQSEFWGGAQRQTLTFTIARDAVGLEDLDTITTGDNLERLELTAEGAGEAGEDITNIYDGYSLRLKLGVEPVLLDEATQTYAPQVVLHLGKRTVQEEQIRSINAMQYQLQEQLEAVMKIRDAIE